MALFPYTTFCLQDPTSKRFLSYNGGGNYELIPQAPTLGDMAWFVSLPELAGFCSVLFLGEPGLGQSVMQPFFPSPVWSGVPDGGFSNAPPAFAQLVSATGAGTGQCAIQQGSSFWGIPTDLGDIPQSPTKVLWNVVQQSLLFNIQFQATKNYLTLGQSAITETARMFSVSQSQSKAAVFQTANGFLMDVLTPYSTSIHPFSWYDGSFNAFATIPFGEPVSSGPPQVACTQGNVNELGAPVSMCGEQILEPSVPTADVATGPVPSGGIVDPIAVALPTPLAATRAAVSQYYTVWYIYTQYLPSLKPDSSTPNAPVPFTPSPHPGAPKKSSSKKTMLIIGAVVAGVCVLAALIALYYWAGKDDATKPIITSSSIDYGTTGSVEL